MNLGLREFREFILWSIDNFGPIQKYLFCEIIEELDMVAKTKVVGGYFKRARNLANLDVVFYL